VITKEKLTLFFVAIFSISGGFFLGNKYGAGKSNTVIQELRGEIKGLEDFQVSVTPKQPTECVDTKNQKIKNIIAELECNTIERAEELKASVNLNQRIVGNVCLDKLTSVGPEDNNPPPEA